MDIQAELIAEFDREIATTRKLLAAIPEEHDGSFKPHPKSMAMARLVGHVVETAGDWAIHALTLDELIFGPDYKYESFNPANKAEVLARFDSDTAKAREALVAMTPEKWDSNWKMGANGQIWISDTKYRVFRTWVLNHLIHHRAQLGVTMRLQEMKIPGMYGPSADEMPS